MTGNVQEITPDLLLNAYANGYFPMAETRDSKEIHWFSPEKRGIIPLDNFHVPRSLKKFLKHAPLTFTTNQCFRDVMLACCERAEDTWINDKIIELYTTLNEMGFAHSVECWQETGEAAPHVSTEGAQRGHQKLIGGLYGVCISGVFFGESMFSRAPNASKAALVHLVDLLNRGGYSLLDTQYVNDHLQQFGVIEIDKKDYLKRLEVAIRTTPKSNMFSTYERSSANQP